MRADPEPDYAFWYLNAQCAVIKTDTDRPITADVFEMEGWMGGVGLEQLITTIR